VNDWLAEGVLGPNGTLGGVVSVLGEEKEDGAGLGRVVSFQSKKEPLRIDELALRLKKFLKLTHVEVASPVLSSPQEVHAPIKSVGICAGSGGSVLNGSNADVYFTGEMSHHEVLAAVASGHHVILCGHTNTERGYLPILAERLKTELAAEQGGPFEVFVSQADAHPLQFF